MSSLIRLRSRVYSIAKRFDRRSSTSATAENPRDPITSASIIGDLPPPTGDRKTSEFTGKKPWSSVKYGIFAALASGIATAGYATYAYSLDEVEERTKVLRQNAKFAREDNESSFNFRLFQGYLTTVPAKLVDIFIDLRRLAEEQIRGFTEPISEKLLPDLHPLEQNVFTIVLDLNETLVFSDWKRDRGWRTFKRPGVEAFLEHLAQYYEIVVYSDQLNMYVDPVIERLNTKQCIRYWLSRGATRYVNGKHYRDLSKLNRDPAKVIYISGHALESSLQSENCLQIKPWIGEADDTGLLDLIPFLEYVAKHSPADIRTVLASYQGRDVAKEFIERTRDYQRRMQEQKKSGRFWRH